MREVDEKSLLLAMKSPVRPSSLESHAFHSAHIHGVAADAADLRGRSAVAMKADKTQFWRSHRSAKVESPRESMATVRQSGGAVSRARSEE